MVGRERGESDVFVGDEVAQFGRETRDLDGVLFELDEVAVGFETEAGTGEVEVVGAEGAVPVRVVGADSADETRDGARGKI